MTLDSSSPVKRPTSAAWDAQAVRQEITQSLAALSGVYAGRLYRPDAAGRYVLWTAQQGACGPSPTVWDLPTGPEVAATLDHGPATRPLVITLSRPIFQGEHLLAAIQLDFCGELPPGLAQTLPWYCAYIASRLDSMELQQLVLADRRELALLSRAAQAFAPGCGQDSLLQQVIDAIQEVLEVEYVGFGLVQNGQLALREFAGPGRWRSHYPLDQGVVGRVARSGVSELVQDVGHDPDYVALHPGVQSELCVPVYGNGKVMAVLNVESTSRRLEPLDLRSVQVMGHWLSRELERERLVADTKRNHQALDLLHHLRSSFDPALDAATAIRAVNLGLSQTFGYSQVSVYLLRGQELVMQHQVGYEQVIERLPITVGVMGRCVRTARQQWVPDLSRDPDAVMALDHINSEICAPLCRDGQVIGVLNVETVGAAARLDDWDDRIIASVAGYLQQSLAAHWLRSQASHNEETYRLLAQHSSDIVCLHRSNSLPTYVSPSVQAVLGYAPEQLCGRPLWRLVLPEDRAVWFQIRPEVSWTLRWRARHRDNRVIWMETMVSRIAGDREAQFLSCSRDITERQHVQDQLQWAATHDALTGLANRAELFTQLEGIVAQTQRRGSVDHAVLYLDIDRFKTVNDTLGHAAGDELLQAFADRLRACARPGDLIARLGGDEFAILMRGLPLPDLSELKATAARLVGALTAPFMVLGTQVQVSASLGLAPGELHHCSPTDLLRNADTGMYRAKRDPRLSVVTFDPALHLGSETKR